MQINGYSFMYECAHKNAVCIVKVTCSTFIIDVSMIKKKWKKSERNVTTCETEAHSRSKGKEVTFIFE